MHYKKSISWLVSSALLLVAFSLPGKNYYLVYSNECMDRLEYSYDESRPGNEFIVYSVALSTGEKILMEVGLESRAPIKTLDTQVLTNCEDAQQIFNGTLADKINNKIDQFYIVTPVNLKGQYRIATVSKADYYQFDGEAVTGISQQYRFDYLLNSKKKGDLSKGDARGSVYYIATLPLGPCQVLNLRQTYGRGNSYLDIYVVPEIGVVEEQSSLANTSYRLKKINNTPFADYLYRICGSTASGTAGLRTSNATTDLYKDSDMVRKGSSQDQDIKPEIIHPVKKGETLFSIAREHGVDVADLKVWNELSTNVIYAGDKLVVSPPLPKQNQAGVEEFTAKGANQVQSYGTRDLFNTPKANGKPAWTQTSGRHVVEEGETILSISRMYGFTEERFRFFNELGPTERVQAGDILLTTDCLNPQTIPSRSNSQAKGPGSYQILPENSNYTRPFNQEYEYTNTKNQAYTDPYTDFDLNYPEEYQIRSTETPTKEKQAQTYNLPPGASPQSPESTVPLGTPEDNFYSPSNYGPIPGRYNNNEPLKEPQSYNYRPRTGEDPTDYQNYIESNQSSKGANQTSGTKGANPYGGIPTEYSPTIGSRTKGLPTGEEDLILTGVKKMHLVKEGETLVSIAARYGTTVKRLRALNNLGSNEVVIPFQQIYVQK